MGHTSKGRKTPITMENSKSKTKIGYRKKQYKSANGINQKHHTELVVPELEYSLTKEITKNSEEIVVKGTSLGLIASS